MAIKIGDATALRSFDWAIVPDDRQSLIETIGGVEVQDFGHVEAGDKITCTAIFDVENALIVYGYWHNRTLVPVTDEGGAVYENTRVIVKQYSYVPKFPTHFNVKLEFWRV